MKKTILSFASLIFAAGTIFTGCQSSGDKVEAAQEDVKEAKQDLREAEKKENVEAENSQNSEEWKTYKSEQEARIKVNEARIEELKVKMKNSGKVGDEVYSKKIEYLEKKNNELKSRINEYDRNQSGWPAFKREFGHDMDELGRSLKDFSVDNNK